MTISSWSASNVTVRCRAGSSCRPLAISRVHLRDPVRGAGKAVAVGVLADREQELADGASRSGAVDPFAVAGTARRRRSHLLPAGRYSTM